MIRFIGNAGLEVVILHSSEVMRHCALNHGSVNSHTVAIIRTVEHGWIKLWEQGLKVLGMSSSHQEMHGLVAVGNDGDKAP